MASVLLITSDPALKRMISWILVERQFDVVTCESVDDALGLIERNSPEVVLLDEPGPQAMEGDAARLSDVSPGLRVIEIDEADIPDRAPDFRAITQLHKPFTADDLISHIDQVIKE